MHAYSALLPFLPTRILLNEKFFFRLFGLLRMGNEILWLNVVAESTSHLRSPKGHFAGMGIDDLRTRRMLLWPRRSSAKQDHMLWENRWEIAEQGKPVRQVHLDNGLV
jgi:hypothetical protein